MGVTIEDILVIGDRDRFARMAMELFRYQSRHCPPYAEYLSLMGVDPHLVEHPGQIPHLPVEAFKSRDVYCAPSPPEMIFTSSTTTGGTPARHMMADLDDYRRTFTSIFEHSYGPASQVAIFALLPCYMQRQGSSLIYMADRLMSMNPGRGGFFLDDMQGLMASIQRTEGPKILLGVTYALLDLAEGYPSRLHDTVVMVTGGMKGTRPEMPRHKLHKLLCEAFGVEAIHSEYGMAELTSQAYSHGEGIFCPPPWMGVYARDVNDSGDILPAGSRGAINITDLANIHSCAFLQTQDMGVVYPDGTFTIEGRVTGSEVRGCNLLVQ